MCLAQQAGGRRPAAVPAPPVIAAGGRSGPSGRSGGLPHCPWRVAAVERWWAASPLSSAQCVATTMHKAKGMEFSHVLLTGLDEKSIPQSAAVGPLDGADRSNALKRERSLLYVAASRARDQLLVTYSATPTPLIAAGAPGENARPAPTDPDEWRTRHRGVS